MTADPEEEQTPPPVLRKPFAYYLRFIGVGVILIVIFAGIFPGLFFLAVPPAYDLADEFAGEWGYDLSCYGMHGDWQCGFRKRDDMAGQDRQRTLDQALDRFRCHSNNDCIVTAGGSCALRGMFAEGTGKTRKCVCLTGPIVFGCVPENQAGMFEKKSNE